MAGVRPSDARNFPRNGSAGSAVGPAVMLLCLAWRGGRDCHVEPATACVRCICSAWGPGGGGGPRLLSAVSGRIDGLLGPCVPGSCVCGVHVAGLVPHSRRSRNLPSRSAEAAAARQVQSVRTSPKASREAVPLDGRRAPQLAVRWPGYGRAMAGRERDRRPGSPRSRALGRPRLRIRVPARCGAPRTRRSPIRCSSGRR